MHINTYYYDTHLCLLFLDACDVYNVLFLCQALLSTWTEENYTVAVHVIVKLLYLILSCKRTLDSTSRWWSCFFSWSRSLEGPFSSGVLSERSWVMRSVGSYSCCWLTAVIRYWLYTSWENQLSIKHRWVLYNLLLSRAIVVRMLHLSSLSPRRHHGTLRDDQMTLYFVCLPSNVWDAVDTNA